MNCLQNGANAIEPDVIFDEISQTFFVNHDPIDAANDVLPPTLKSYLIEIREAVLLNPTLNFSFLALDCKNTNNDINLLFDCVRENLTNFLPVNVLATIAEFKDREYFKNVMLRENEAVGIDEDNFPQRIDAFFQAHQFWHCLCSKIE